MIKIEPRSRFLSLEYLMQGFPLLGDVNRTEKRFLSLEYLRKVFTCPVIKIKLRVGFCP